MLTTLVSLQWFPSPPLVLFFFFIAFLSIFSLWRRRKESLKGLKLPPSPPKLPIIGNLHQLGKLPHQSLSKLSRKYGPVMFLQLGYIPTIVVSSAEAAKDVLKTHDLDTCTRPRCPGFKKISYNYSDVAFSPYGEYWREIRKILTIELLSTKRVNSFGWAREEELSRLIEFLSENSSSDPVELDGKILALVDGIVRNVAFGKYYGKERFGGKDLQGVMKEVTNVLTSFSNEDFFPTWWGRAIDKLVGRSSRLDNSFHDLDGYIQMLVDKHRGPARPSGAGDFVDVLISLQRDHERSSIPLNDCTIKALLMNAFLGSVETSSVTIMWAMSELMRNPRVMKKAQTEIRSCLGTNHPTVLESDDIANMKYLKMVVKETLRLHPVAPLLVPHETIRQCRIGGYDVFPGTRIFINAWAIGRDPNSWPDSPEEFNPDRFEGKDIDFKGQNFELLPFGSGRRMCPGLAMGVAAVEFTLANLLYRFDWELPQGMKPQDVQMQEEGGIVVHNKVPLCLVPIKYI